MADSTRSAIGKFGGQFGGALTARASSKVASATNAIGKHLTVADVTAAKRELAGEVVARKADGTPYDHVTEVNDALKSVGNAIDALKSDLASNTLATDARDAIEETISKLSKFKDAVEDFLRQ